MKYCDACHSSYPHEFSVCPKDQGPLRAVDDLAPGIVLRGKYEIIRKLGAGGMGAVYLARHKAFGETRAIKVLGMHLVHDESYLARFRSEAVLARKLQHENAVRVDDLDATEDGRPYIVMEYVEGKSLRAEIREHGQMELPRAVDVARQALAALGAAHDIGIIHRDIKPDNILVIPRPGGAQLVKVLDFGLAKLMEGLPGSDEQVSTRTGIVLGTPEYMSPEQAMGSKGDEIDGRADIYALGIVLYEMATGRVPFRSDTPVKTIFRHLNEPPRPPQEIRRNIPPALADVILKALAKDADSRFATAREMADALSAVDLGPRRADAEDAKPTVQVAAATPVTASTAPASRIDSVRTAPTAPLASRPRPSAPVVIHRPPAESTSGSGWPWIGGGVVAVVLALALYRAQHPPVAAGAAPATMAPAAAATAAPAAADAPSDGEISAEIQHVFFTSGPLRDARLNAEVVNGIVTLSGEAPTAMAADLAKSLAGSVKGVRQVFSSVTVASSSSTASSTASTTGAGSTTTTPATEAAAAPEPAPARPPAGGNQDEVRRLMGDARQAMDTRDFDTAERKLEEVLRLDPGNPRATEALTRLRSRPPGPGGPGGPRPPGP